MRQQEPTQTSAGPLRAAIYARISRDREGAGLGVERQEADCRALAERLGWQVVEVFADNDLSAYSGRRRPQYEAMLAAVRSGRIRGVLAWHTDRLNRRAVELENLVDLVEAHGVRIETVTAGEIDLSTASGRLIARLLGATAQHEVDHARERMRRAKAQAAADGKYRGGPRPYGYELGRNHTLRVVESEAAVIREATRSVLAGRSLRAIARELNEQGHLTSTGRAWTYARLRDVLIRPRNAGLIGTGRFDRGSGHVLEGVEARWPAIVDRDTWQACHDLLTEPSRRKQQRTAVRWLGSGIYVCGRCGGSIRCTTVGGTHRSQKVSGRKVQRYYYRCADGNDLMIRQDFTDDHVRAVLAELVRDPRVRDAMRPEGDDAAPAADRERRIVLVRRLEQVEADYDEDLIDARTRLRKAGKIEAELAEVDGRLAVAAERSVASPVLDALDPGQAFLDAPVDVQRAILTAVLRVEILPSARRGVAWSAERIKLCPVVEEMPVPAGSELVAAAGAA